MGTVNQYDYEFRLYGEPGNLINKEVFSLCKIEQQRTISDNNPLSYQTLKTNESKPAYQKIEVQYKNINAQYYLPHDHNPNHLNNR